MKRILYLFVTLSLLFPGCNYLDIVPENDIETIETIFEKREDAEKWLKSCYAFEVDPIISVIQNPAYTGTDEVVSGSYLRSYGNSDIRWNGLFIADGLQMAQEPYGNIWKSNNLWAAIRYCNIFIENIGNVYNMTDNEKELWKAEIKAEKAMFYFELMRRYGPIILVPENIDPNVDILSMQQPRRPIDTCVNAIVTLLDEAMKILPHFNQKEQSRQGFHSLESAAALKAQVLLYAASPLFNGNPAYATFTNKKGELLFPTYNHEKWKKAAEATEEAIDIAIAGGKHLIEGNGSKASALLNTMADIENSVLAKSYQNDEAIYMIRQLGTYYTDRMYIWQLPFLKSDHDDYNPEIRSGLSPSLKMVEMYYTDKGLPIEFDPEWNRLPKYEMAQEVDGDYRNVIPLNTNVLKLHLRREPRFYAHIAADRCYWQRGKQAKQNLLVEAYRGESFGSHFSTIDGREKQNLSGYWIKKGLYTDIPTKQYQTDVAGMEDPVIVMRLADLYLMKAEAWNEYLDVPDERVYDPLNKVRERAGIPKVQEAWQYSTNPAKATTKVGMRDIIHREWDVEFAFEGRRFWNLRRWLRAAEELNGKQYGWNILGENAEQFYNYYKGPIVVWEKRKFVAPRDYLFPIRSEEVMISGCVQNPNW